MLSDGLTTTHWWLILSVLMVIIEILSPSFGYVLVAVAALISALLSFFNVMIEIQVGTFAVATVSALVLLRPKLVKKIYSSAGLPHSRADELVGKLGLAIEDIDNARGRGRVLVEGLDWAARSEMKITKDEKIKVVGYDGIVLIVEKAY